jgi:hypothetical protein
VYGYNVTHCDLNRKIALKNALKKMSFQDVKLKLQMGSRLMGRIMPKIGAIYDKDITWLQLLNKYISKKKHALRNVKKYKK